MKIADIKTFERRPFSGLGLNVDGILFRTELFSGFNFTTGLVVCITAMINHKFISFCAVQKYDLLFIYVHSIPSTGILRPHNVTSSHAVGSIAQLVEKTFD